MKEKKNYLSPSMEVVEIECQGMLMASGTLTPTLNGSAIEDATYEGEI